MEQGSSRFKLLSPGWNLVTMFEKLEKNSKLNISLFYWENEWLNTDTDYNALFYADIAPTIQCTSNFKTLTCTGGWLLALVTSRVVYCIFLTFTVCEFYSGENLIMTVISRNMTWS